MLVNGFCVLYRTPLHIAIMADNRSIFDILIEHPKIDINLKTIEHHTPLYYALLKYESGDNSEDSYAVILIKKGAELDVIYPENENNLLQILIMNEAENAAILLLNYMENLNHVNVNGESALHVASMKNSAAVVGKLLQMGADANLLTKNEQRQTPLHYCVLNNSVECIREFIKYRDCVNFNARDANGDTPISLALNEGYNGLVPILIEGKADVNVRNGKDFTLLHQAILKEDSKTAIFLLDNGADINAQ